MIQAPEVNELLSYSKTDLSNDARCKIAAYEASMVLKGRVINMVATIALVEDKRIEEMLGGNSISTQFETNCSVWVVDVLTGSHGQNLFAIQTKEILTYSFSKQRRSKAPDERAAEIVKSEALRLAGSLYIPIQGINSLAVLSEGYSNGN